MAGDDGIRVYRDEVVREAVLELLEPPRGDQRQHFALVRDRLR